MGAIDSFKKEDIDISLSIFNPDFVLWNTELIFVKPIKVYFKSQSDSRVSVVSLSVCL